MFRIDVKDVLSGHDISWYFDLPFDKQKPPKIGVEDSRTFVEI